MRQEQSGFTLVEIVVVIVLIGILSAVALPRFYNFTTEAERAVVEGTAGALSSGLSIVQTKWLLTNQDPLRIAGKELNMSGAGFPNGVVGVGGGAGDIISAAACAEIAQSLLDDRSVRFASPSQASQRSGSTLKKDFRYIAVPYDQLSPSPGGE